APVGEGGRVGERLADPRRVRRTAHDCTRVDAVHALAVGEDIDVEELGRGVEEAGLAPRAVVTGPREAGEELMRLRARRRADDVSGDRAAERDLGGGRVVGWGEADVERRVDVREPVAPGAEG